MPHPTATTLAGAALITLLPAGTALAGTLPRPDRPAAAETALTLSVTHPAPKISGTRTVTLRCSPPGGTHPHAAAACGDLGNSRGRIIRDSGETICTAEYRPVLATAVGRWRGRAITFSESFPNDCVMHARTGAVFLF